MPKNTVVKYLKFTKIVNLFFVLILFWWFIPTTQAQQNVIWNTQSQNSSESMPVGGGDIGLNLWVEKGEVYLYLSRSGTFDENNTLLKLGRVKLKFSSDPFEGKTFKQELILKDGYAQIDGSDIQIKVWVDVFNPVIHVDVKSKKKITTEASYESWRFEDRITKGKENNQNSYKWAPQGLVKTAKDEIAFENNGIQFYHQNKAETVFDVAVNQQGLADRKAELYNPIKNLIFGGLMEGKNMVSAGNEAGTYLSTPFQSWKLKSKIPSQSQEITIALNISNAGIQNWEKELYLIKRNSTQKASIKWWNDYWKRSFVYINSKSVLANQSSENYQLFRYMLGCNAFGKYPTKFNGGLFTFDPQLTDTALK
ncbi:MAG: hypothetical protein EOO19_14440, partial [Chryseobacterium sp.]